ncbi:insecticidal delta-endotoxin Cry8Ea1 family protein, partial [Bacillus thuringiensis]|uniref:insecticidal delta-endotoxin Cry8Ea1 family protein n=1 Tax=Bacillus thuringiensis TaxID=1428 RepID=UPI0018CCAB23
MDQQNEYEIIQAGVSNAITDTFQRYPLANNPNTSFQNMNYKDYLNDPMFLGETRDAQTAITTSLEIISEILGFLGVPFVGPIIGFTNRLINLLWPRNTTDIWNAFMDEVQALINESITKAVRSKAISELEGIHQVYRLYIEALNEWKDTPDNPFVQERVRTTFRDVNSIINYAMPSFRVQGFEIPLLVVYAQAANLHLVLLRDATLFGAGWGFTETNINDRYNEQVRVTNGYIDHCTKWYNEGLTRLKNNWSKYHQFRREMTLMVLDLIALFPSHDARRYPMETSAQLTRDVYTDPIGYRGNANFSDPWTNHVSFSKAESETIRPPHLFDTLESVEINTAKAMLPLNDKSYMYYWAGHTVTSRLLDSSGNPLKYTYGSMTSEKNLVSLPGKDVYRINSVASGFSNYYAKLYGVSKVDFSIVDRNNSNKTTYSYSKSSTVPSDNKENRDSENELPQTTTDQPDYKGYSHRLSHITFISSAIPTYVWTRKSADLTNTIYPDKITQIPAVKMYELGSSAVVVKGPGFTGGDLVKRTNNGSLGRFKITIDSPGAHRYRLRVRYHSDVSGVFHMQINNVETIQGEFKSTVDSTSTMSNDSFQLREFTTTFRFPSNVTDIKVSLGAINGQGNFYLDRIEFAPVDTNYDERITLEKAQKAVNALFTEGRNALQTDMTDYKVDQVSILVDCVSGEVYPNEKRELLNLVKYAKRLSIARNLLVDPNFTSIHASMYSEDVKGWYGSNGIATGSGDVVLKENYVSLPSTSDAQYPTYLYQKIDESKLKAYTRYKLRGFIENSQDLEAYVVRYDAKHETLDVSNNLLPDVLPVNACGEPDRCAALQYLDENPRLECSSIQDGILSDSHSFSLNIDTGSIDLNENVGIWVLFKISTPEGYAKFGNLEVIEDGPVSGEALARVKRQETKWRNKLAQLRTETQAIYTRAKQALDNLFTDAQDSYLKIGATFAAIVAARKIVQSIREAYMSWLSVVPGVNYPIFTELNERVQRAFQLYDGRNVVRNGRFLNGVLDWIVTSDVSVQEENGNNVLVLSNWDAQVLQCLKLYQDRGYILRVTARKEGLGEGYITITDEEGNTDQLTFGSCEEIDTSNSFVSTGYMTKELEFFPDTE